MQKPCAYTQQAICEMAGVSVVAVARRLFLDGVVFEAPDAIEILIDNQPHSLHANIEGGPVVMWSKGNCLAYDRPQMPRVTYSTVLECATRLALDLLSKALSGDKAEQEDVLVILPPKSQKKG